jgi:hypothetical protein
MELTALSGQVPKGACDPTRLLKTRGLLGDEFVAVFRGAILAQRRAFAE